MITWKFCLILSHLNFFRTLREVPAHVELLVWYGDDYGDELGLRKTKSGRAPRRKCHHLKY